MNATHISEQSPIRSDKVVHRHAESFASPHDSRRRALPASARSIINDLSNLRRITPSYNLTLSFPSPNSHSQSTIISRIPKCPQYPPPPPPPTKKHHQQQQQQTPTSTPSARTARSQPATNSTSSRSAAPPARGHSVSSTAPKQRISAQTHVSRHHHPPPPPPPHLQPSSKNPPSTPQINAHTSHAKRSSIHSPTPACGAISAGRSIVSNIG